MKLHLGCGRRKIHDWCNVDIDPDVKPDLVDDVAVLSKIEDNSVKEIYASHVLEHFSRSDVPAVLKTWYNKLTMGGTLRVAVPDFEQVTYAYSVHRIPLKTLMGFLVGGQRNDFDYHHIVFDFKTLKEHLHEAGFSHVCQYNWQNTEHFYIDDYASSYLPHMDKGSGLLMSLNVVCHKLSEQHRVLWP